MAHLYDDDSDDDDFGTYGGADYNSGISQPMFGAQPSFGMPSSFGAPAFGGGYGGMGVDPLGGGGYGGMGSDPLAGGGAIGFGQASKFGGIGATGNPFGVSQPMGVLGSGGAISTDYVDLSGVKAPEISKHQPNKFATSAKSSMKKPGKRKDEGRGVSFGDVTTFHVDKESQQTGSDRKSKSEENDEDDSDENEDDDDEDEIENNALANTLAESSAKEKKLLEQKKQDKKSDENKAKPGAIAQMIKKMSNIEESITESGSMGLKKSLESDDSTSKQLSKMTKNQKSEEDAKKQRSPTGLSDSGDLFHHKSQDLDSKKLSSEYDSAELSRNFNYEESEDTSKFKPKSDKSKKSHEDETEYEEDFDASSNLHESSSMSKAKRSHDKDDDIEDIRKRNMKSKSYLDAYTKNLKSQDEDEEELSKRLDSYRARDEIHEESENTSNKASPNEKSRTSQLSDERETIHGILRKHGEVTSKSLELDGQKHQQEKFEMELKSKKHEMDAQVNRMEAHNAVETNKILKERIMGYVQDINKYRVEIEALKRQVDIADSNSASKEVELNQITEEYESRLKLEREKNAHTNIRQESREINELKRELRLVKQAHEQEAQQKFEEIDYLTKRWEKLESENVALRVGNKAVRDAESKAKKYEEEVHSLRMRLKEQQKSKDSHAPLGTSYNTWTKEQLVHELNNIDRAIERFTKENESLMHENRKQKEEISELNALLYKESQKLQDYRHKVVKESGSVLVVEDEKDLHAKVLNDLGIDHAITQKEYNNLKEKLYKAEKRLADIEQVSTVKEIDYKKEIDRIREQRVEAERKLVSLDSALKTQMSMNETLKNEFGESMSKLQTEKEEIEQKLGWYMENQDMLDKDIDTLKERDNRIDELKEEIRTLKTKDGGRKRISMLEKQVKDLQDALSKKNPDSIPLLLSAVKPSIEEQEEYRALKKENEKLKKTLQEKDDEFDKKIRNLRIEIDKMKSRYEKTAAISVPADVKDKRIQDLERQLQETKDYYLERIKKLQEEKPTKSEEKISKIKGEMKHLKEIECLKKEVIDINKSKKSLEKEVRTLKQKFKERPADLSMAINALMDEDYIFWVCGLYKQTLTIKKRLEKGSNYDKIVEDIKWMIDDFEKASNRFKSNRATILFSKVIDKWMDLSKVLDASTKSNDKSKPHIRLTAIEHLLKEEIESWIGDKLDKNTDLLVVDIDESVSAKRSPQKHSKPTNDDEDYWSDFSDDDYSNEAKEEKQASEVLSSLQRWNYNSNLELDLSNKFTDSEIITLDDLKTTLYESGYYCSLLELQTLLKRLDITNNFGIKHKQFIKDLMEKNAAWWKERLSNNGVDVTAKGRRNGNYRALCNKAIYKFILNNLGEIVKEAIHKAGYLSINECFDEIYQNHSDGLSKRDLRNELLNKEIPLTRLDTHILYKTIEDEQSQKVSKSNFRKFLEDPRDFMNNKTDESKIWVDDEFEYGNRKLGNPKMNSPGKPTKELDTKITQLEKNIKEKNKLIIQLEKDVGYFKEIAMAHKAPSESYSKDINALEKENRDLNRKLRDSEERYSRDKKKFEQLIKENISTPEAGDFILLQKKLEMMEQTLYEREKEMKKQMFSASANSKDKKEIKYLKEQMEAERHQYGQIIDRKNQEIRIFREELDVMLQELDEVKNQNIEKERLFMQNKSALIPH